MNDEELQNLLRDMRDDPVPPDSLVRMRAGLEHRISRRPHWKIAAWLVSCAAVAVLALLIQRPTAVHRIADRPAFTHERQFRPPETPRVDSPTPVRQAIHRTRRRKPAEYPQLAIRIETPDPEVVILLIADQPERNF